MLSFLLLLTSIVFTFGVLGLILNRTNLILILMSIELLILAINLNFIVFSLFLDDLVGRTFSIFVLALAAAESSIGLAFIVSYFRAKGNISVLFLNLLKN